MAIDINAGFNVGAPVSIDERLTLSKAQMLSMPDYMMPDVYLSVCTDDGKLYTYNKKGTFSNETGYFSPVTNGLDDIEIKEEEDTTYTIPIEITVGTSEDIECTKTVTTIGNEVTTIIIANVDSSNPNILKADDVVSITKEIDGIIVYEYNYTENSTIISPFD